MNPVLAFIATATGSREVVPLLKAYRSRTILRPKRARRDGARNNPQAERIIAQTCAEFGVAFEDVKTARRGEATVAARYVLAARLYLDARLSFPAIGEVLGYREHSGAFYAAQQGAQMLRRTWPRRYRSPPTRGKRRGPTPIVVRYAGFDHTESPL